MILSRKFHAYKEESPLLLLPDRNHYIPVFNGDAIDALMKSLILELSDLATLPPFAYIARHSKDKIPREHLAPFLKKFPQFVDHFGSDKQYSIPTIWFACHFYDEDSIAAVRQKLDQKNLKYFLECEEYDSFEKINDTYWDERSDAELFVKFIHQATMIGIDLLTTAEYKEELKRLGRLESLQYTNIEDAKPDFKEMERYLRKSSSYYNKHIIADLSEYKEFWENFTKWKITNRALGSWPHFLFNICGIQYPYKHTPLKINTEELFEDWW